MANILFVNRRIGFNRGGGEQVQLKLSKYLQDYGHKIYFLIGSNTNNRYNLDFTEFPYFTVPSPYLVNIWQNMPQPLSTIINLFDIYLFQRAVLKNIEKIITDNKINIIEIIGLPSLAIELQKRFSNVKIITHFPGPPGKIFYSDSVVQLKHLYATGDAYNKLIAINPRTKNIPNGFDHEKFSLEKSNFLQTKYHLPSNVHVLLTIGRLAYLKNHLYLLNTINELLKIRKNFILFIVGDGPLKKTLIKTVKKLKLSKYIIFTDHISNDLIPKYYNSADLFLLPSLYENLPIVIIESFASGLPVIATQTGGIPLLVKNNYNGLLIPLNQPKKFADKIDYLLDKPKILARLSSNCFKTSLKFDWKKSANLYQKYFLDENNS